MKAYKYSRFNVLMIVCILDYHIIKTFYKMENIFSILVESQPYYSLYCYKQLKIGQEKYFLELLKLI